MAVCRATLQKANTCLVWFVLFRSCRYHMPAVGTGSAAGRIQQLTLKEGFWREHTHENMVNNILQEKKRYCLAHGAQRGSGFLEQVGCEEQQWMLKLSFCTQGNFSLQ